MEKSQKIIIALIISMFLFILIIGSTLAWIIFIKPNQSAFASDNKKEESKISYDIKKEFLSKPIEITTNLKLEDIKYRQHYIKTTIVLSALDKKELSKIEEAQIFLKDIYVKFFNEISYKEITELQISEIRNKIKASIEEKLKIKVNNVYLTEFLIQ